MPVNLNKYFTASSRPVFGQLSQSAFSPTNTNLTLKRPIPDPVCDHDKYERADDKSKIYLPAEFDPRTVVPLHTWGQLDEGSFPARSCFVMPSPYW